MPIKYNKFLKFILAFMVVCLVVLSSLHLYIPVFMRSHLDQLQESFADDMYGITLKQCQVTWGGLFNPLGAELKNVVLENPWSKSIHLSAETIRVSLKTRALIRGKVDIGRIKIRGARLKHTHFEVAEGNFELRDKANGIQLHGQLNRINITQVAALMGGPFNTIAKGTPLIVQADFNCYIRRDLHIKRLSGHITQLGSGSIYHAALYPKPMDIQQLSMKIIGDQQTIKLRELNFKRGNASGNGEITFTTSNSWWDIAAQKGQVALDMDIHTKDVPFADLPITWPQGLAPTPRQWVTTHIKTGYSPKSHLTLVGHIELGDNQKFVIDKLDGTIEARDAIVSYYGELPAVHGVNAHMKYNKKQFLITLLDGHIKNLNLTKGYLNLHKLDQKDKHINITLKLKGPANDTLNVIAHKPLQLPQKLGVKHQKIGGNALTDVHLSFPLKTSNTLKDVNVAASAKISNASLPIVQAGGRLLGLEKGQLKLSVTRDKMNMQGKASIDGMPADIAWEQWFRDHKIPFRRQYKIKTELDVNTIKKLGLPYCEHFSGATMVNCTLTTYDKQKETDIAVSANLSGIRIDYPKLALKKSVSQPGKLAVKGKLDLNKPQGSFMLHDLLASTQGLNIKLTRQGNRVVGHGLHIGGSTFDIDALPQPNKTIVKISSPHVNGEMLKRLLEGKSKEKSNMEIHLAIQKLACGKYGELHGVAGSLGINNGKLSAINLHFHADDSGRKSKVYSTLNGKQLKLHLKLKECAWLLSFFQPTIGITEGDMAGTIAISQDRSDQFECAGNLQFHQVLFSNAPVMMRFLTFCSPGGLKGILTGSGAHFADGQVKFRLSPKEIVFKKILFTGPSLAIRAHGTVDRVARKIDMKAEASPLYLINAALANLLPWASGGSKDGVFTTPVSVKGSLDDPKITTKKAMTLVPRGLIKKRVVMR